MKDIGLIFKGKKEELKSKLKKYIFNENQTYNELTLKYNNKWVWIYIYHNNKGNIYVDVNFSKAFLDAEVKLFTQEMYLLGFIESSEEEEELIYE